MFKLSNFQKLLSVFVVYITCMIAFRMIYSGNTRFFFLLWNLFLAWMPFQISLYLAGNKASLKWTTSFLLAAWLLFFPNALYIITDLIHLEAKTNVPIWYDAVLLFTSAGTGLSMAFASLYKVETFLLKQVSHSTTNKLVLLSLFMGSFGVYLGRFLRWNSWDIVTNPFALFKEIAVRFLFPIQYYQTWAITILFTSFFSLLYFAVKKISIRHIPFQPEIQ